MVGEREFGALHTDVKYIRKNLDKYMLGNDKRLEALETDVVENSDDRKFRNKVSGLLQFAAGSGWATAVYGIIQMFVR